MDELRTKIETAWGHVEENLLRVHGILALGRSHARSSDAATRNVHSTDVLRAGVVFLHAALEEWFRALVSSLYIRRNPKILDEVPLLGTSESGRASKFFLGALHGHLGKSVDQLIQESIDDHVNKLTCNNVHDITKLVTDLGLSPSKYSKYFPPLEELMSRRHQIVHRADRIVGANGGSVRPISERDIDPWLETLSSFIRDMKADLVVLYDQPPASTIGL